MCCKRKVILIYGRRSTGILLVLFCLHLHELANLRAHGRVVHLAALDEDTVTQLCPPSPSWAEYLKYRATNGTVDHKIACIGNGTAARPISLKIGTDTFTRRTGSTVSIPSTL